MLGLWQTELKSRKWLVRVPPDKRSKREEEFRCQQEKECAFFAQVLDGIFLSFALDERVRLRGMVADANGIFASNLLELTLRSFVIFIATDARVLATGKHAEHQISASRP